MENNYIRYYLLLSGFLFFLPFLSIAQIPAIQWENSYGGSGDEESSHIIQTSDGGYLAACYTTSDNGDVTFHYPNLSSEDYWIVKFNSCGIIEWQKTFGGSSQEQPTTAIELANGDYIIGGQTSSSDGNVVGLHGSNQFDLWVIRLDANGNLLQQKCFGGSLADGFGIIKATPDGGFIMTGECASSDGDVTGHHNSVILSPGDIYDQYDYWVVKLDALLNIEWKKCFGGSSYDVPYDIIVTKDAGYIVCGESGSSDGDVTVNYGFSDIWIVKLDNAGNLQWQKSYGGDNFEYGSSIYQNWDEGYLVLGMTSSAVTGFHGNNDAWVLRLDQSGNVLWEKALGGSGQDELDDLVVLPDTTYLLIGGTTSNDGDVSGSHGGYDGWVVHIDTSGNIIEQKCFGGSLDDYIGGICRTKDKKYILSSSSASNDGDVSGHHPGGTFFGTDLWIAKLGDPFSPGAPPVLSSSLSGNSISSYVDTTLSFTVSVSGSSTDSITMQWLNRSKFPASIQFHDTSGHPVLNSIFDWTPDCREWKQQKDYDPVFIAYNNQCQSDSLTVHINLIPKPVDYSKVKAYNLCTPNGDNKNDLFVFPLLPSTDCDSDFKSVEIYNRYGSRIFYSTEPVTAWDPGDVSDGIYYYYVRYSQNEYKGWLEVLR